MPAVRENHPSVVNTKHRKFGSLFTFKNTNENDVHKLLSNIRMFVKLVKVVTFQQKP